MIEIVFNESAAGSLKVAQHYGKGLYREGAVSVFLKKQNGSEPTEEEKETLLKEIREKERIAWEQAIPIGGNASDVFCFAQGLSMGDISEDSFWENRNVWLSTSYSIYPHDHVDKWVDKMIKTAPTNLETISKRSAEGEPMRIWYSDQPDELCGMYWMMAQIAKMDVGGSIYVVKLPDWEEGKSGTVIQRVGWGEVSAEEWGKFVSLQREISKTFIIASAARWRVLQEENTPLRGVLNGRLVSLPEHIYDSFILKEIEQEDMIFQEARLIGRLMGKYQLGISDVWFAFRIEEFVRKGILAVEQEALEGEVSYRRTLRKPL